MRGGASDIYLGFSEDVVRQKMGTPRAEFEGAVGETFGMHAGLCDKFAGRLETKVKQLSYDAFPHLRVVVWLARDRSGEWVVVGDETLPDDAHLD